jgi:hypothetical protein
MSGRRSSDGLREEHLRRRGSVIEGRMSLPRTDVVGVCHAGENGDAAGTSTQGWITGSVRFLCASSFQQNCDSQQPM